MALAIAGSWAVGSVTFTPGDFYTASEDSRAISQYSSTGQFKGALAVSSADADTVRGMAFLEGSLYAVAQLGSGFNLVRIDADGSVHVLYRDTSTYVRGNLSFGKLAATGGGAFRGRPERIAAIRFRDLLDDADFHGKPGF